MRLINRSPCPALKTCFLALRLLSAPFRWTTPRSVRTTRSRLASIATRAPSSSGEKVPCPRLFSSEPLLHARSCLVFSLFLASALLQALLSLVTLFAGLLHGLRCRQRLLCSQLPSTDWFLIVRPCCAGEPLTPPWPMEGEPGTLFNAEHGLAEVRSRLSVANKHSLQLVTPELCDAATIIFWFAELRLILMLSVYCVLTDQGRLHACHFRQQQLPPLHVRSALCLGILAVPESVAHSALHGIAWALIAPPFCSPRLNALPSASLLSYHVFADRLSCSFAATLARRRWRTRWKATGP